MKTISKRIRAVAAAAALTLTVGLAGCGAPASTTPAESTTFTYWSMWKIDEPQQKVIATAIADFEKETGIKVQTEWQGRGNYQKLTPALNTNTVPDLIDGPYSKAHPALVATDQALGLQSVFDMTVDGKKVSELIPAKYSKDIDIKLADGQPWMVPYQIQSDAMWYNAANFPALKTNPPKTWDEFMTVLGKVKADGKMAPVAADGDIGGYNAAWVTTLIIRELGPGGLAKIAADKSGEAWKAPEVLAAATRVQQMVKGGYVIDGYAASKFPLQQQKWADNKAAFIFMGSWLPTESSSYVAKGFDVQSFPFPKTGTFDSARVDFSGWSTPKKAKNADAAKKFMAFFMKKKYQDAWGAEAKGIPVREDAASAPELAGVQAAIKAASSSHMAGDGVAYPGYNEKVFWPVSDSLFHGKITAQEFVDKMVKDQKAYWASQ